MALNPAGCSIRGELVSNGLVTSRRGFVTGALALLAASAIVSASSLMKLQGVPLYGRNTLLTVEMITREAVKLFMQSHKFLTNLDEQYYYNEFNKPNALIGSTLRIWLPNDYVVNSLSHSKIWFKEAAPLPAPLELLAASQLQLQRTRSLVGGSGQDDTK